MSGNRLANAAPVSHNVFDFEPEHHAGPLPSPCINICTMNPASGLCDGCLRSIDEIIGWGNAPEARKLAIWRELKHRIDSVVFK